MIEIGLKINGEAQKLEVAPMARLIDIIRGRLSLTGTKEGCGEGECGACAILMNGELVNSCLVAAVQVDGAEITTIEGLVASGEADVIQKALIEGGGIQCGICTPGMIMAAAYLLRCRKNLDKVPAEAVIRSALSGNLCRCTGYSKIIESVAIACSRLNGAVG